MEPAKLQRISSTSRSREYTDNKRYDVEQRVHDGNVACVYIVLDYSYSYEVINVSLNYITVWWTTENSYGRVVLACLYGRFHSNVHYRGFVLYLYVNEVSGRYATRHW